VHWTVGLIIGLAVALLVVVAVLWFSRTRTLTMRVGSFGCGLADSEGGPSRRGIAQYGRAQMYWWRRASLAPRPARAWRREGLVVLDRRALPEDRPAGQRPVAVLVHCKVISEDGPSELWLTMGPAAYAGFLGWIEATPTPVRMVF
jgi:hypothetical protein